MTRAPPLRTPNSNLKTNDKNRTSPRGRRSEPTGQNLPRILRTAATPPAPRPRELPRPCNTECKCTPGSPAPHPLESSLCKGRCYARRATFRPSKKRTKFIHEYKSIFVHKKGHYGEHSSRPRRWSRPLLCPPSPPSFETRRYLTLFHCSSNQTPIKPVDLYGIILLAKLYLFSPPTN